MDYLFPVTKNTGNGLSLSNHDPGGMDNGLSLSSHELAKKWRRVSSYDCLYLSENDPSLQELPQPMHTTVVQLYPSTMFLLVESHIQKGSTNGPIRK